MPLEYARLSTYQISRLALDPKAIPVIPAGSIEQHCSAPLATDAIIAEGIAYRACSILEREGKGTCIILPTLYYGFSPEWRSAPGTISLSSKEMIGIISSILSGLKTSGFKKAAIINGHGGNTSIIESASREWLSTNSDFVLGIIDYWKTAGAELGHCDKLEENLLSDILGERIDCRCERLVGLKGTERIMHIPPEVRGVGIESSSPPVALEDIYRTVADAISEIVKAQGGVLSL